MKKYILKSINIIALFCFIIGIIFVFIYAIESDVFTNAKVIDIQGNIIKVEAGEKNGDPIIYEIEKPFYKKLKSGDYISVKQRNGIVKYTINRNLMLNIGIIFILVSCVCIALYICYNIIIGILLYKTSKNKSGKK